MPSSGLLPKSPQGGTNDRAGAAATREEEEVDHAAGGGVRTVVPKAAALHKVSKLFFLAFLGPSLFLTVGYNFTCVSFIKSTKENRTPANLRLRLGGSEMSSRENCIVLNFLNF
ncbi:hypothetical protein CRG98_015216 [Punica granatum]|uniref:Uncharacterized protein n=1 Tax=Punica granatum TaxID=22663 RepID=A0A2I0K9E3_PUNGR|nr:hypothetical protein CRG98_015216 [Punica granatum]